jgi:3-isopropylmalate/(R)-2-methylmalate dehydratase small subunit
MESFTVHQGLVAVMDRVNVDTDQIIPKQFLKRIERTGFGQFLFFDWRFQDDGSENPEFELNQPSSEGASILVAGRNFGCGSSREHAVWALADYGFRCVIAESYSDIFYNNCFKNGILPIVLDSNQVQTLMQKKREHPDYRLKVDLSAQKISDDDGMEIPFDVDPVRKEPLLKGLDDIGLTLQHEDRIAAFEAARQMAPLSGD